MRGDLEWGTIPGLVQRAAREHAAREALVEGDVRLTFAELGERVTGAARAAMAAGVEPGDRVGIWAPNIHEWVIAALGTLAAGGVLVPLNTRFKGPEAAYILGKSRAKVLFTVTGFLDTDYVRLLADAGADLPDLARIVVLRGDAPAGTTSWSDFLAAGGDVPEDAAAQRAASVKGDDLSDVIFTSGTTGQPKGAMITHEQSLRVYADWGDVVGLRAGDRYLIVMPFFHTFGYKAGFLASIMRGVTVIPLPVLDVPTMLELIERERVSMLPGAPTLYQTLLNHPDRARHDLSSLRLAVTGAAVVPVELVRRMRSELGFETVITGYGLTESSGTATMCRHDDDPETIASTSGRAIPDVEVRVVDDDGNEVARGEPGEVVVRGYNVMRGYLDEPEETAAAIDGGGWLHTGDVGVMDDRGYLRITDRKKDMFIVGGFNAYPAEIESMLLRHPKLAQVAVVGVPDPRMGEVGMAFAVPRAGEAVTGDEVIEWARAEMANYKVPRYVEIVDQLPLNASGKVLKFELRERGAKLLS